MIPVLRSLVNATSSSSTHGPETRFAEVKVKGHFDIDEGAPARRNCLSRKRLILNQYYRRVQRIRPRTAGRERHQTACAVEQPDPLDIVGRPGLNFLPVRN